MFTPPYLVRESIDNLSLKQIPSSLWLTQTQYLHVKLEKQKSCSKPKNVFNLQMFGGIIYILRSFILSMLTTKNMWIYLLGILAACPLAVNSWNNPCLSSRNCSTTFTSISNCN